VVLYGSELWSRTVREQHKLVPFDNRIQRKIFEPKWWKYQEVGKYCIMRSFLICALGCTREMNSGRKRWV